MLMRQRISALTGCLLVALFFLTSPVSATVLDDVVRDFKPVTGVVIMPAGDEYLIDLDASKRVAIGDEFAVVKPGEKIIHPVTKEVLGNLDEIKGILQVTRVKTGYSYARLLTGKGVERGDQVRRFSNMKALFLDYTGQGQAFAQQLEKALPALEWVDYATAQAARPKQPGQALQLPADVIFILQYQGLEARDRNMQLIHAYPLPESLSLKPAKPGEGMAPALAPVAVVPAPVPVPVPNPQSKAPYQLESTPRAGKGISYNDEFAGFEVLAPFPKSVLMSDFAWDKRGLLIATTDGMTVQVYGLTTELHPIASADNKMGGKMLTVAWWRPKKDGPLLLVVSTWRDGALSGALFELKGDSLQLLDEGLPYLFGTLDRDGDGQHETLLGQGFDKDDFFDRRIREIRFTGSSWESDDLDFDLPNGFVVDSGLQADLLGNGQLQTVWVRNGFLTIDGNGKEIYQSPKMAGGSLSFVTWDTDPGALFSMNKAAYFEVPPIAVDLDGDGQLELVSVASERSTVQTVRLGPGVNESWLAVFKAQDGRFQKGTIGDHIGFPIQGLAVAGQKLLCVATKPGNLLGEGSESYLLAFPLAH